MQEYIHIPIDVWDVETISIYLPIFPSSYFKIVRSRDLYTLYITFIDDTILPCRRKTC